MFYTHGQLYNSSMHKKLKIDPNIFNIINKSIAVNRQVYFIDVYRPPIERKISSFFWKYAYTHIPNYSKLNVYQLIHIFYNKFLRTLEEYHSINEVMNHYNVPLFTSFDFDKKYNIITKNNMHFIKLRVDNISEFDKILAYIFQIPIKMHNDNVTNNKPIYSLYQEFVSRV